MEVIAWRGLHHPNVVPLLGVTIDRPRLAMVSRWMPKGSIREYTKADTSVDRLELVRFAFKLLILLTTNTV